MFKSTCSTIAAILLIAFVPAAEGQPVFRIPFKGMTGSNGKGAGVASITTGGISFGGVATSTTATQQTVLSNSGGQPLTVTGVAIGNIVGQTSPVPFTVTQACVGTILAAGQSCSETVTYRPTVAGTSSGNLSFATSVGSPSIVISGFAGTPVISASQKIDFGEVFYGQWSSPVALSITNAGNIPVHPSVTVGYSPITSHYQITSNCTAIAAGASCTEYVSMLPFTYGSSTSGWLNINSEAATVRVETDIFADYYGDTVSPGTLSFGTVAVGSASSAQYLTLTNTGNVPDTVYPLNTGTQDFQIVANTCSVIPVGGTCTFGVVFTPTTTGPKLRTLSVSTSAHTWGPALSGTGG